MQPVSKLHEECLFSTMLGAGVVSLAGSASGIFPTGLHGFAWLHVEPRPVPELAWGGEFVDRAVCRSRPRRDVPKLFKEQWATFEALKRVALRWGKYYRGNLLCAIPAVIIFQAGAEIPPDGIGR